MEEGEKILPAVAKGPCDTAQLPKYVTAQYLTLKHALSCKYNTLVKSENFSPNSGSANIANLLVVLYYQKLVSLLRNSISVLLGTGRLQLWCSSHLNLLSPSRSDFSSQGDLCSLLYSVDTPTRKRARDQEGRGRAERVLGR